MSDNTREGGADSAAKTTYTQAEVDQLLTTAEADNATAVTAAREEATTAERERIQSILGCDAAKTRPALAHKLAFSAKGYSGEDAAELLEASAEESGPAGSQLSALMQTRSPGVSSDDGGHEQVSGDQQVDATAQSILNA